MPWRWITDSCRKTRAQLAVDHLANDILRNSHQQTFADALGNNPTIPPGHLTTGFHGSRGPCCRR